MGIILSADTADENHLNQLILLMRIILISLSCWWESSESADTADENHLISLSCWWKSSDQLILLMRIIWSAYPGDENHLNQLILVMRIIWISLSWWWESSESAYPADVNHLISLSCWCESSDQLILLMKIIWSAYPADENHLISLFCWWESSESADTALEKTRLFRCQLILPDGNLLGQLIPADKTLLESTDLSSW